MTEKKGSTRRGEKELDVAFEVVKEGEKEVVPPETKVFVMGG